MVPKIGGLAVRGSRKITELLTKITWKKTASIPAIVGQFQELFCLFFLSVLTPNSNVWCIMPSCKLFFSDVLCRFVWLCHFAVG